MWRLVNIAALLAAVVVGVAVMQVKYAVKERRAEVSALASSIRDDREHIRVLEAELALLASPHLLQERSHKFLALMPVRPAQVIESPMVIPLRPSAGVRGDLETLLPGVTTGKAAATGAKPISKKQGGGV